MDLCKIYALVEPDKIVFVDRVFETSAGVGIVSTLNGKGGLIVVNVTPDTRAEAKEMLLHLPMVKEVLDVRPEQE